MTYEIINESFVTQSRHTIPSTNSQPYNTISYKCILNYMKIIIIISRKNGELKLDRLESKKL